MAEHSGWSLTESDPLLFTQLLKDIGVKGLQVDDLYSLDAEVVNPLKPIYALIFLFKYVGEGNGGLAAGEPVYPGQNDLWFANQVVNNSCATVAALNAVMNIEPIPSEHPGESIEIGEMLANLREFGQGMDSATIGHMVSSHQDIRQVHNSFSQSTPFSLDPTAFPEREKEDPYHFVAYVPYKGGLYELDGLRETPLYHGEVTDNDDKWVEKAREVIFARIETYPAGSLMFNLLAIRAEALPRLERLMKDQTLSETDRRDANDLWFSEKRKADTGRQENALRRHNLLPAIFFLCQAMGETGDIEKYIEDGRTKAKERRQKAAKEKE